MSTTIVSVRVEKKEKENFEKLSRSFGLTLQDLLRMFISDTNRCRRVTFSLGETANPHVSRKGVKYFPFENDTEATAWAESMATEIQKGGK